MAETLFHCDDILWARFVALCRARDETPDERLLVRLRLLVAEALAVSENWGQLQRALGERGLKFEPSGGGLVLTDLATGATLAKSSQVGLAYLDLVRPFGTGFPGHPLPGLALRALARP
jgi:hypothetical protein